MPPTPHSSVVEDPAPRVAIIGAGPAGLTAGYLLAKQGVSCLILEADPTYVGGISKTIQYKGFRFDIGGHRFFSKSAEVEALWSELLPDDMIERPRSSKIYYRGKFFHYPLKPVEALLKLGVGESVRCVLSYAKARLLPVKHPKTFEEWVSNQFGRRLFSIFFKTYTEKVWGLSCRELSADWAAQRIKGLSLLSAVWSALKPRARNTDRARVVKTLIDRFRYPRLGPGMLWEACADRIREAGGRIRMGALVTGCRYDPDTRRWSVTWREAGGEPREVQAEHVVASAPLRELIAGLTPPPPPPVRQAAQALRYRDFITVALIARGESVFADNWIYIHDPTVLVGRIQNYKAWSPAMTPGEGVYCLGLEYFCFEGDAFWNRSDADLIALAKREVAQLGLLRAETVTDGCVVRQPKAYPIYDDHYAGGVQTIRAELESRYPRLHVVGRNGMHRYNNQDHSMMTAMLCVKNILADRAVYDLWRVNQDAEYHESGAAGSEAEPPPSGA